MTHPTKEPRAGWKLVPVEPTEEMLAACDESKPENARTEAQRQLATKLRDEGRRMRREDYTTMLSAVSNGVEAMAMKAAIDALCEERKIGAFEQLWFSDQESITAQARTVIDAYLASPSAPVPASGGGEVKPLEWRGDSAETMIGEYVVCFQDECYGRPRWEAVVHYHHDETMGIVGDYDTRDEAVSGAQEHYTGRIRSTLSPAPTSGAEAGGVQALLDALSEFEQRIWTKDMGLAWKRHVQPAIANIRGDGLKPQVRPYEQTQSAFSVVADHFGLIAKPASEPAGGVREALKNIERHEISGVTDGEQAWIAHDTHPEGDWVRYADIAAALSTGRE